MKKICIIVSSPLTIKAFLLKHIIALSRYYDVTIIANEKLDMKNLGVDCDNYIVGIDRKINIISDIKSIYHLFCFFKKHHFNLVISVTPKAGFVSMIASFLARVGVRIHFFTGQVWATKNGIFKYILKFIDKIIASLATNILVDSLSQKKFLVEQSVVDNDKASVLLSGSISGVDVGKFKLNESKRAILREQYTINEGDVVFMFIGRVNIDKGIMDIYKVFNQIFEKYSHIKLFIVGPDEGNMKDKIQDLLINKNVFRIDYIPDPENILNIADILILPSYREGFGTIVIEAGAMQIPCIGSRIYGLTDAIIDGKTGLLHNVGDIEDILLKYELFINNRNKINQFGIEAKNRVYSEFVDNLVSEAFVNYVGLVLNK